MNKVKFTEDRRFYLIHNEMVRRCTIKIHPAYKNYGGRGIKCAWKNFLSFKKDMYKSYLVHCKKFGIKNTTIERVNNEEDYKKSNCSWATREEQARNRRNNRWIIYKNKKYLARELAQKNNIKISAIYSRLNIGWDIEKVLKIPIKSATNKN